MKKPETDPTPDFLKEKWRSLPFTDFKVEAEKMAEWKKYACLILEKLKKGNVGLIADTGTGKTIMALLVYEALELKTLFLAPTVILVNQHAALYKKISGQEAEIITGEKKQRDWQAKQLTIATPHVFQVEQKKGLVNVNDFDLIFIDELHKGSGDYPYVQLVNSFKIANKKVIALSASPGANFDKVTAIQSLYGIKNWVTADIEMPTKDHRLTRLPVPLILQKADEILRALAFENLNKLNRLFVLAAQENPVSFSEEEPFLTQKENEELDEAVKRLPQTETYIGRSLFAKHRKISHVFKLLMTESYFTFLDYIENSLKDQTKATKSLLASPKWQELYWLIKKTKEIHPKQEALIELAREMIFKNKRMLVFVNHKKTATYLSDKLSQLGYQNATLFGGQNKSAKKQEEIVKAFVNRKISIILATSVVEEGLSLPEVDVVVHYSQPMTEISRLQRDGRTGRLYEGLVCFIITDILYENALYFATLAKVKKMRRMFYESFRKAEEEKRKDKKRSQKTKKGSQKTKKINKRQLEIVFQEDLPF